MQVDHEEPPTGLEIGQHGNPFADCGDVVEGEGNAHRPGHGQEVEDRVGGPSERHHHSGRIFERCPRHDVAGFQVRLQEATDRGTHGMAFLTLGVSDGRG